MKLVELVELGGQSKSSACVHTIVRIVRNVRAHARAYARYEREKLKTI